MKDAKRAWTSNTFYDRVLTDRSRKRTAHTSPTAMGSGTVGGPDVPDVTEAPAERGLFLVPPRRAAVRHDGAVIEGDPFADVLSANAAYARNFSPAGLDGRAARRLAVLTCIDSRIDPLAMLGLEPGDAKIVRNAGARVTDDVLTTLMVATYLLDVRRVMVIAHTDCRMVAESDDELRRAIRESGGPDTADLSFSTSADQAASVCADVERIRSFSRLETLQVGGFVYDVKTGVLSLIC
jgi:carbonic anhydrase